MHAYIQTLLKGNGSASSFPSVLERQFSARIQGENHSLWLIYGTHTALRITEGIVDKIHMYQGVLKSNTLLQPWYINSHLFQSASLSHIKEAFPEFAEDFMQDSDKLNVYQDNWDLEMYLDENSLLTELRFSFY